MSNLFLIRHGQSVFNLENRFTGWLDIPLSEKGIEEAKADGVKLMTFHFDIAYTSALKRASDTLQIILNQTGQLKIPVIKDIALNERNYGDLQGLNKSDTEKKYGKEQVLLWRRSFDTTPPGGESLKDTAARVTPFFNSVICKDLADGKNVLVVAHGNTLRAIIKMLDKINDTDIMRLNIETGAIYLYTFDRNLTILSKKIL